MCAQGGGYRAPVTPGGGYRRWPAPECLEGVIAIGQQSTDLITANRAELGGSSGARPGGGAPGVCPGRPPGGRSSAASRHGGFISPPRAAERLFAGRITAGGRHKSAWTTGPRMAGEPACGPLEGQWQLRVWVPERRRGIPAATAAFAGARTAGGWLIRLSMGTTGACRENESGGVSPGIPQVRSSILTSRPALLMYPGHMFHAGA